MRVICEGFAVVGQKETGAEYEIAPNQIEWETQGDSEEEMGESLQHIGEVDHEILGTLTWNVREYPVGVMDYKDEDMNGHTLIENFSISLGGEDPDTSL